MSLLALVIFNIFFGIILYYLISIRVSHSVREYQNQKLKKEIQAHTLNFYRESDNYLALMDSKITILKNLLDRAEASGINLNSVASSVFPNPGATTVEEHEVEETMTTQSELQAISKPTIQYQPSFLRNLFEVTGKAILSVVNSSNSKEGSTSQQALETGSFSPRFRLNSMDYSVGGNPLEENDTIVQDKTKENDQFKKVFHSQVYGYSVKPPKDKVVISVSAALKEIPEDAGKVDKVVHLLRSGFSKEEISTELELAMSEIKLIETIKMEKIKK
jgi:hypothetical protein